MDEHVSDVPACFPSSSTPVNAKDEDKDPYFKSYSNIKVHRLMLLDEQRICAYKEAIFSGVPEGFWQDKVVLDVGAGTGVLSLYCAKAGAKKVYAVEADTMIAELMEQLIGENDFNHIIKIVIGRIEDISLPSKVDVIISEWMGFYLLHESMLQSVIFAREKYLKSGGIILPEYATLHVALCSLPQFFGIWDNFNGIKMKSFANALRLPSEPEIDTIEPSQIISKNEFVKTPVYRIDLNQIKSDELENISFNFISVCKETSKIQAVCLWFDVYFPRLSTSSSSSIILSTSPFHKPTHWKQTLIVLPTELNVIQDEPIVANITFKIDAEFPRRYNIEFEMLDPDAFIHPLDCSCYNENCKTLKR